jgi:serine phosphatase RsbU (regulator of sigma subunit)
MALVSAIANLAAIKIDNLRLFSAAVEAARMERELALAARIQKMMLAHSDAQIEGYELTGFTRPCLQVGGDYFDFIKAGDCLTVTIADVAGKGVGAALLMASCKAMLTTLVESERPIIERVEQLNRYVMRNSLDSKFITLLHAELDPRSDTVRYCNAGHNPGLVVDRDGEIQELEATGLVLGLMERGYTVGEVELGVGGALVLYTDGVTEAESPEGEEFGQKRLEELVRSLSGRSSEDLQSTILHAVEQFRGNREAADDVTLVIVSRSE